MTYAQLYALASTWTARHVAQDHMLTFGRDTEVAPTDLRQVSDWQEREGGERIPTPQVFPTEGPRESRYEARDPQTYGPCQDSDCRCHASKQNLRAFGSTASEALAEFWESWENA